MTLTQISLLMVAGAVLWMGAEYMEDRNHPRRHVVPTEAELVTVAGELVSAQVVEVKAKKGVLANRYIELAIRDADRTVKVQVKEPHAERDVEDVGSGIVTAKFDPQDENRVYALSTPKREAIKYADSAAYKTKLVDSNSGGYTLGWIVFALGIAGLWLGRKPAS
jgi:hypothetical protein